MKKIIKIRADVNEIENRKATEKTDKTKTSIFEKINKINKPLARINNKNR